MVDKAIIHSIKNMAEIGQRRTANRCESNAEGEESWTANHPVKPCFAGSFRLFNGAGANKRE